MFSLAKTFLRHPNAANLLMMLIIIAGIVAFSRMNVQFFPTFTSNLITIRLVWPGASSSDMEASVIRRIEPLTRSLNGVDKVESEAREGSGVILVWFVETADMRLALNDVEAAVGNVQNLPQELETPKVENFTLYEEVSRVLLSGPFSEWALADIAQEIRNDLIALGIDRVSFLGRRSPEVRIEVSEASLREYGLTLGQIGDRLRSMAFDQPLGDFGLEMASLARIDSATTYAETIGETVIIPGLNGAGLTLNDLATLSNDVDRSESEVRSDQSRAVELIIERVPSANSLQTAQIVSDYLEQKKQSLPESLSIVEYNRSSDLIADRINMLLRNGISGLVIVLLLLILFLEFRITAWIVVGIPIAFCASGIFLLALDQSINMISLFAFIMVLGIVVDDAIVVGEHIVHLSEQGYSPLRAAELGIERMSPPIVAGALTTCATFLPILFIGGIIGDILQAIPIVVIVVLAASLFECFYILPYHMRVGLTWKSSKPLPFRRGFNHHFQRFCDHTLRRLVEHALEWRYTVVALMIAGLLITGSLVIGGKVKFIFFTGPESSDVQAEISFLPGTPREYTMAQLTELQNALETVADQNILKLSITRLLNDHQGQIRVELVSSDERAIRTSQFIHQWRQNIVRLPGLEKLTIVEIAGGPPGRDIDIRLYDAPPEVLKRAVQEVKKSLATYQGVYAISDNFSYGKQEAILSLTPYGRALGFTLQDVAGDVRAALDGIIINRFVRGEDEVITRLLLREQDQQYDILSRLYVTSRQGVHAALSDVVSIERQTGYLTINRENGVREVTITASVDPERANPGETRDSLEQAVLDTIAQKFSLQYRFSGRAEEQGDTFADMRIGGVLAFILVYAILAWILASYVYPFIVMSIIPFGLMGAIMGHYLLNYDMTIISLIGFLGLSGLLVNDSVILINTIARHIVQDKSPTQAVVDGVIERFRPILLTSLTTVGGLIPLLFETSLQAQFLIPMVITLVFGISTATVLVLFLASALLMIQNDISQMIRSWLRSQEEKKRLRESAIVSGRSSGI